MDTKEFRSSPFVLKKITPDGFAVPNIFCRPKLFSIPPSLLMRAVKKKAHKLRWGMKAQKKSRQKEKAIPERGFKKRSLNLAEA